MENNKNFFLAIILSIFVVVVYYYIFPPPAPPPEKTQTPAEMPSEQAKALPPVVSSDASNTSVQSSPQIATENAQQDLYTPPPVKKAQLKTEKYSIALTTEGAAAESIKLLSYNYSSEQKVPIYTFIWNLLTGKKNEQIKTDPNRMIDMAHPGLGKGTRMFDLTLESGEPIYYALENEGIEHDLEKDGFFKIKGSTRSGLEVEKTFSVRPDSYIIDMGVKVTNASGSDKAVSPSISAGAGNEPIKFDPPPNISKAVIFFDSNFEDFEAADLAGENFKEKKFEWFGITSHYFATLLKNPGSNWSVGFQSVKLLGDYNLQSEYPLGELQSVPVVIKAGDTWQESIEFYVGPKDTGKLEAFDTDAVLTLEMSLNIIAQPMIFVLRWFHSIAGNWGVAIILLTILVRVLIFPLAYKGMKSMRQMSKVAPKIQALKNKYGNDKERFNREVMEVYKKGKVNPMGGCLPLIIQIPIFFALYSALMPAIELRHSPFILWIHDLSQQDYTMILPVLCGVTMFLQQMITPTPATMDPMQQKIMRFFPVMMFAFFAFTTSGLVLYWTVSGFISVGQQYLFNKYNPPES